MSSPNEEFAQLRKLLSLKKYEQPPPGHHDYLRRKVMRHLEAEELSEYSSWWHWLIQKFDARPVLVCAYGVAVSGLLLAGFRVSQVFENEVAATPVFSGPWLALTPSSNAWFPEDTTPDAVFTPVLHSSRRGLPVFREAGSSIFFNEASGLRFSPIHPAVSKP